MCRYQQNAGSSLPRLHLKIHHAGVRGEGGLGGVPRAAGSAGRLLQKPRSRSLNSNSAAAHFAYLSIYCFLRKQEIPTTMGEAQSSAGQTGRIKDSRKTRWILMGFSSPGSDGFLSGQGHGVVLERRYLMSSKQAGPAGGFGGADSSSARHWQRKMLLPRAPAVERLHFSQMTLWVIVKTKELASERLRLSGLLVCFQAGLQSLLLEHTPPCHLLLTVMSCRRGGKERSNSFSIRCEQGCMENRSLLS